MMVKILEQLVVTYNLQYRYILKHIFKTSRLIFPYHRYKLCRTIFQIHPCIPVTTAGMNQHRFGRILIRIYRFQFNMRDTIIAVYVYYLSYYKQNP